MKIDKWIGFLWLLAFFWFPVDLKADDVDWLDLNMLEELYVWPQWKNIEGEPYLVSGKKPHYNLKERVHEFCLEKGQNIIVTIPESERLRLVSKEEGASLISLYFSNGSSLYRQGNFCIQNENEYIFSPDSETPLLVLLENNSNQDTVRFALGITETSTPDSIVTYTRKAPFSGEEQTLTQKGILSKQQVFELSPSQNMELDLEGPLRLECVSYLDFSHLYTEQAVEYWLIPRIDDFLQSPVQVISPLSKYRQYRIKGEIMPLGLPQRNFLDIPKGKHHFSLHSTHRLFVSISAFEKEYLLPGINAPHDAYTDLTGQSGTAKMPLGAMSYRLWGKDSFISEMKIQADQAKTFMVDNGDPWGLNGAIQFGKSFSKEIRRTGISDLIYTQLASKRQFFRQIYPLSVPDGPISRLTHALFDLRPWNLRGDTRYVYPHMVNPQDGSHESAFVPLPKPIWEGMDCSSKANHVVYELPDREFGSTLRLMIRCSSQTHGVHLNVKLNDCLETLFFENTTIPDLGNLSVSREDMALAASLNQPANHVGYLEMSLDPDVQLVEIWSDHDGMGVLSVSLEYLAEKPYLLSENVFEYVLKYTAADQDLLNEWLHQDVGLWQDSSLEMKALSNHFLPVVQIIQSNRNQFVSEVRPDSNRQLQSSARLTPLEIEQLRSNAFKAEQDKNWTEALVIWNQLLYSGGEEDYSLSQLGKARCFHSLDRTALSNQILKGLMVNASDAHAQMLAIDQLENQFLANGDEQNLLSLYSFALIEQFSTRFQLSLADCFFKSGQIREALLLYQLLPRKLQNSQRMIECALHLGEYQMARLIAERQGPEIERYLEGMIQCISGQYQQGIQLLKDSIPAGTDMAQYLVEGLEIEKELSCKSQTSLATGIRKWESWQTRYPGELFWVQNTDHIVGYAGSATLSTIDTNRFLQYFELNESQPFIQNLAGPKKIQIEIRPVHPENDRSSLDEEFSILIDGKDFPCLMFNNRPSQNLQFAGRRSQWVGQSMTREIQLGNGQHQVRIETKGSPLVIRVKTLEPLVQISPLPAISGDQILELGRTEKSVENGQLRTEFPDDFTGKPAPETSDPCVSARENMDLESILKLFQYTDQTVLPPFTLEDVLGIRQKFSSEDFYHIRARLNPSALKDYETLMQDEHLSQWEKVQLLLGGRQFGMGLQALLDNGFNIEDTSDYMRWLFTCFKLFPEWQDLCILKAFELSDRGVLQREGEEILGQMMVPYEWSFLEEYQFGEGFEINAEHAEWLVSDDAMVSLANFPPLNPNQKRLLAGSDLIFYFNYSSSQSIEIDLNQYSPDFLDMQPTDVTVLIDEKEAGIVALSATNPSQNLKMNLEPGAHWIRFALENPPIGQQIAVQVAHINEGVKRSLDLEPEQVFHICSKEKPLQYFISHPTRIRIDRFQGEGRRTEYLSASSKQIVTIEPDDPFQSARVRVYTLEKKPFVPELKPFPKGQVLPERIPHSDASIWYDTVLNGENLGLCEQGTEDGAYSFSWGYFDRKPLEEDSINGSDNDTFHQFTFGHQFYNGEKNRYSDTSGLFRFRQDTGHTYGFQHEFQWFPPERPFSYKLGLSTWVQKPDSGFDEIDKTIYNVTINASVSFFEKWGRKSSRLFTAGLFSRHINKDRDQIHGLWQVDNDIFTIYKSDHLQGVYLGEAFRFNWYKDSRFSGNLQLNSNEDLNLFNPDNLRLKLGWQQLIGVLDLSLDYRLAYYFDDDHRVSSEFKDLLELQLNLQKWTGEWGNMVLNSFYLYDLKESKGSFQLVCTYHRHRSKGYADFAPDSVRFREIRQIQKSRHDRLVLDEAGEK